MAAVLLKNGLLFLTRNFLNRFHPSFALPREESHSKKNISDALLFRLCTWRPSPELYFLTKSIHAIWPAIAFYR